MAILLPLSLLFALNFKLESMVFEENAELMGPNVHK